jgi:ketosteroid isomerase-like protein
MMNRKLILFAFIAFTAGLFLQCSTSGTGNGKEEIINADKAFSALSEEKGMKHAFLEYASEEVVMLRENSYPLIGKKTMTERFKLFSDTGFILTWEPKFADVAASGDLGYSYGIYTSTSKDEEGKPTIEKGTYVSVWKRDHEGDWKFVLDTGNEGLGEQR